MGNISIRQNQNGYITLLAGVIVFLAIIVLIVFRVFSGNANRSTTKLPTTDQKTSSQTTTSSPSTDSTNTTTEQQTPATTQAIQPQSSNKEANDD